jgi:hypothetical protein
VLRRATLAALASAALAWPAAANTTPGAPNCPILPADNVWHADISSLPVHAHSQAWTGNMAAATTRLHPDFGPSGEAMPYGLPYTVVPGSHGKVTPSFQYADESDPGPYPFGADTPIEGGEQSGGDRHALMIDRDTCVLFELYDAHWNGGQPTAGSGAVFNLRSNALRPATWTSADAAGLPILPGLLRLDEVQAGRVDHAIRFTAARTDRSFLWPARHQAGAANDPNLPPMGARFRLRANFDLAPYRADTQVVLRAMQRHGLILADNGSNWFFQGTAENGWDDGFIADLKRVPASAFEAVDESSLMVDPNSGQAQGAAPTPAPAPPRPAAPRTTSRRPPAPATTAATVPPTTTTSEPAPTTSTATSTTGPSGTAVALGPKGPSGGRGTWVPALAAGLLATAGAAFATALRLRRLGRGHVRLDRSV